MKAKLLFIAIIMVCVIQSCTQDLMPIYSCNEATNEWVKENISMITNMSRKEWNQLDESKKLAAYRGFSQQQRIKFWFDKLEEVKSLDWSKEELEHINLVGSFISSHQNFFSGNPLTDDQLDILYSFCYKWIETGIYKFGWTKMTGISIIGTGNTVMDKLGGTKSDPGPFIGEKKDCYCHAGNILFTTCIGNSESCEETDCNSSFGGCGWMLMEECNGECI